MTVLEFIAAYLAAGVLTAFVAGAVMQYNEEEETAGAAIIFWPVILATVLGILAYRLGRRLRK